MSLSPGRSHTDTCIIPVTLCVWNIPSTSLASAGIVRMRCDPCQWHFVLKLEAVRMKGEIACVLGFRMLTLECVRSLCCAVLRGDGGP
jgi:hypothetical protein